jgi:hypothetical protein
MLDKNPLSFLCLSTIADAARERENREMASLLGRKTGRESADGESKFAVRRKRSSGKDF